MANNRLTPENVVRTGLAATYLVAGAGQGQLNVADTYQVNNDEAVGLHFKKSGAGACIVTIVTPGTVDGLAITERTITVPATTGDRFIGLFPAAIYNNSIHDFEFTLDEVTGLTLAVLRWAK